MRINNCAPNQPLSEGVLRTSWRSGHPLAGKPKGVIMIIDPKLFQKILEQVEGKHGLKEEFIDIEGYDPFLVGWHCNHLIENNMVKGIVSVPMKGVLTPVIGEITIKGSNYLRDLQSKSGWKKYRGWIKTTVFFLFDILKNYGSGWFSKPPSP